MTTVALQDLAVVTRLPGRKIPCDASSGVEPSSGAVAHHSQDASVPEGTERNGGIDRQRLPERDAPGLAFRGAPGAFKPTALLDVATPIKEVCHDQGRTHAEKRSKHVLLPLIDENGRRGVARARRAAWRGRRVVRCGGVERRRWRGAGCRSGRSRDYQYEIHGL
jgi:hypothetical protein